MIRGIHTSEFWITVLTIICLTILVALDKVTLEIALGLLGASGAYTMSRGASKWGGVSRTSRPDPAAKAHPPSGLVSMICAGLIAFAALGLLVQVTGAVGCATSSSVRPVHDAFVVEAERDLKSAFYVVDAFLLWEERNRHTAGPAVTAIADDLRIQFPAYLTSAQDVLRTYKRTRTPEGRADLATWLQTVQAAMLQAVKHMPAQDADAAIARAGM